jgi:hypothetical protein
MEDHAEADLQLGEENADTFAVDVRQEGRAAVDEMDLDAEGG